MRTSKKLTTITICKNVVKELVVITLLILYINTKFYNYDNYLLIFIMNLFVYEILNLIIMVGINSYLL